MLADPCIYFDVHSREAPWYDSDITLCSVVFHPDQAPALAKRCFALLGAEPFKREVTEPEYGREEEEEEDEDGGVVMVDDDECNDMDSSEFDAHAIAVLVLLRRPCRLGSPMGVRLQALEDGSPADVWLLSCALLSPVMPILWARGQARFKYDMILELTTAKAWRRCGAATLLVTGIRLQAHSVLARVSEKTGPREKDADIAASAAFYKACGFANNIVSDVILVGIVHTYVLNSLQTCHIATWSAVPTTTQDLHAATNNHAKRVWAQAKELWNARVPSLGVAEGL